MSKLNPNVVVRTYIEQGKKYLRVNDENNIFHGKIGYVSEEDNQEVYPGWRIIVLDCEPNSPTVWIPTVSMTEVNWGVKRLLFTENEGWGNHVYENEDGVEFNAESFARQLFLGIPFGKRVTITVKVID